VRVINHMILITVDSNSDFVRTSTILYRHING